MLLQLNQLERVATALTVYGIETQQEEFVAMIFCHKVATALTVYGIETGELGLETVQTYMSVATALTVYGIETEILRRSVPNFFKLLQQLLPFTVLKPSITIIWRILVPLLQQLLPFTVLKLSMMCCTINTIPFVATALTVYGIETKTRRDTAEIKTKGCNSSYRLRY